MPRRSRLRNAGYALLALCSGVVFGRASERCDTGPGACPGRYAWIISCGVISALIAVMMLALSCCPFGWLPQLEAPVCVLLLVRWSAGSGVATTTRTVGVTTIVIAFSFGALLVSLLLVRGAERRGRERAQKPPPPRHALTLGDSPSRA
jgi:hypothetical protein